MRYVRVVAWLVCVGCVLLARDAASAPVATDRGAAPSDVRTGIEMCYGIGRPRDTESAARIFRRASRAGDPVATAYLALMTKHGDAGAESDLAAARRLARRAEPALRQRAEAGDAASASAHAKIILADLTNDFSTTDIVRFMQVAADAGLPEAQHDMGRLYWRGVGVRRDLKRAEDYLKSAAVADRGAKVTLGYLWFSEEEFANHHTTRGLEMMASAYAEGEIEGLHWLGHAMENLPEDQRTTSPLEIFREAAEKGSPGAMTDLGQAYLDGKGVEQDEERALYWYRKAAARGNVGSMMALSHWYEHTTGPGRSVSEALRWLKRAADYGHANAYYDLAYAHANGKLGTSPDTARELALIRKGADRGSVSARYRLGVCYLNGDGVGQDFVAALELLLDVAERGEKVAPDGSMEMVAYLYDRGARGIPANGTEAVRWLRRAAKRKSGWALARLGAKYLNGEDVEQDSRKAFDLFRRSASAGEADGMAWLGYAYQHGYRTERNLAEARRWYQRAADKGSEWATKSLRALDGASKPGLLEQLGRALRRGTTTTTATGD